jgi:hypothetical protein
MPVERLYLPMLNREADYCVTNREQKDLARKFGSDVQTVRNVLFELQSTMHPQKTANKTKALINAKLEAVMPLGVRAL